MKLLQPMLNQYVVNINNLNYYFDQQPLRHQTLFNINLKIKYGEIIIMTGPSGSGKTTLLTLIGGLRSPQEGSIKILNQELNGASNDKLVQIRRHIGYIFQAHNLLEFLTARQNVQISLELHKEISEREARYKSQAILKAVKLGDRMNYYPHYLSGGQKQRVAIARALVSHPKLILADEPTAALDSKTGRDIVELMRQLAKQQECAILMVTHDNRILDIADRIIQMEDGRLINTNTIN
ncbi:DevA family ABC transporter ATP-binding protein [Chlorogloeopsis fritschii PCC 9212]|uniref:ABC transporter n=2 Tax=Chlorogloeopsis fritschii TaxID=1124 RepID=A0A433MW54_CHLFR|nr:DevA family ABC transporter ATP-binding protein [Chlorogloeopsis fritschii]RUR72189.1 ABC transporter [Chlorogloeopsis fritschii PCC 6912]